MQKSKFTDQKAPKTEEEPEIHPAVAEKLRLFSYTHLPPHLLKVSQRFHDLAHKLVDELPCCSQLTLALQDLVDAKDKCVRAAAVQGDHCGTPVADFALVQDDTGRTLAIPGDKTKEWALLKDDEPVPSWAQLITDRHSG